MKKYFIRLFVMCISLLTVYFWLKKPVPNRLDSSILVGWESLPRTADPRYATDADSQYLEDLIHCSLIKFDKKGGISPELIKEKIWLTATTLQIEIFDNFKFSDNSIVDLEDIKSTYELFLKNGSQKAFPRSSAFNNIKSLEIKKKHLVFQLEHPDASFISNLVIGILPKNQDFSKPFHISKNIRGCGHYQIESKTLSDIVLEKNPHHPYTKQSLHPKIIIRHVREESTRFAKLLKGELDLVQNGISPDNLLSIKKYSNLKKVQTPGLKTAYLGFNFRDPILSNNKIRQALAMAINKDAIVEKIMHNMADKANTLLPPNHPYFNTSISKWNFDPEISEQLLDQEGYKRKPDGKRFDLNLKMAYTPTRMAIAKAIQENLRNIGIKLSITSLEWGRFKHDVEQGLIQMWLLQWVGFKDPDIFRYAFSSQSIPPNGANRGHYSSYKLDKLLQQGQQELNEDKRKTIYFKIQELVQQDIPYIFLFHEHVYAIMRKNIHNFTPYADGRFSALSKIKKEKIR